MKFILKANVSLKAKFPHDTLLNNNISINQWVLIISHESKVFCGYIVFIIIMEINMDPKVFICKAWPIEARNQQSICYVDGSISTCALPSEVQLVSNLSPGSC